MARKKQNKPKNKSKNIEYTLWDSLGNAIEIVLDRIGEYQKDEQLKENYGRMRKEAVKLRQPDMKPVPGPTGNYRSDLADLWEWRKNPYDKQQPANHRRRKSKSEKIALIVDAWEKNPNIKTSDEMGRATGLTAEQVRQVWGIVKTSKKAGKHYKGQSKTDVIDPSASCSICQIPLSGPFECENCKEIITGECKTCHYTNKHPNDAIP